MADTRRTLVVAGERRAAKQSYMSLAGTGTVGKHLWYEVHLVGLSRTCLVRNAARNPTRLQAL